MVEGLYHLHEILEVIYSLMFQDSVHLHSQFNLEALVWSCAFGTFLLRFMTLGTKINKKYKSVSVLITEQINLYVQVRSLDHCRQKWVLE